MTDPVGELAKARRLPKSPCKLIGEAPNFDATEWHLSGRRPADPDHARPLRQDRISGLRRGALASRDRSWRWHPGCRRLKGVSNQGLAMTAPILVEVRIANL